MLMSNGRKDDGGKTRWSLVPWKQLEDVVQVLGFGADKYGEGNWREVPDMEPRYFSAAMRHMLAWRDGELSDRESGFPHLAHAICCLIFLMWKDDHNVQTYNKLVYPGPSSRSTGESAQAAESQPAKVRRRKTSGSSNRKIG